MIALFLALAFGISLSAFCFIATVPAARSPESRIGLPFWLVMVWGPSLAALILAANEGTVTELLERVVQVTAVHPVVWVMVVSPLVVLALLRPYAPGQATGIAAPQIAIMVGFNLVLGPLGEELGWRGVLQTHWAMSHHWLWVSLLVGVIWIVWHLPLWLIDSLHAQIALPLFAVHVMLYAIIIGAAHALSGGSLLPAILLHLTFNLASNLAVFFGFEEPNAWFSSSITPLAVLAVICVVMAHLLTG